MIGRNRVYNSISFLYYVLFTPLWKVSIKI